MENVMKIEKKRATAQQQSLTADEHAKSGKDEKSTEETSYTSQAAKDIENDEDFLTRCNTENKVAFRMRRVFLFRYWSEWFTKCRNGDTDLADQPRSGRLRKIDREAIIEAIEKDPACQPVIRPMISNAQTSRFGRL
ncbi:hypothetical protein KIN20_022674 [Parelaphostrongylus tenuis]|uniref:Uncharacterized protein n=1 Tax=Parelaphostrongylus tenuis TaxID=148309 RepID=A0AAD5MQL7_PARTN|nr:hypothetical protein KIN20_022674 [Parelaphostrongylus tenuis]